MRNRYNDDFYRDEEWRSRGERDERDEWQRTREQDRAAWSGSPSHAYPYGREPSAHGEAYGSYRRNFGFGGYGHGVDHHDMERQARDYGRGDERGPERGHDGGGGFFGHLGHNLNRGIKKLLGKGPKGYKRSDERIREDVNDRLWHLAAHTDVDLSEVEVMVKDAEVTLTGFVVERRWKRLIEDVADEVSGVSDVHNQLRVRSNEPATYAATTTTATGMAEPPNVASDNGARRSTTTSNHR